MPNTIGPVPVSVYEFTALRAASYEVVVDDSSLPSDRVINDDSIAVTLADGEQNSAVDFSAIEYVNPVDLALLIPLFGAGLGGSISSVVFNGFVDDATNATSIGDVTFIDTVNNRIVFAADPTFGDSSGSSSSVGSVDLSGVRIAGVFPRDLSNEIAVQLAASSQVGETLVVGGQGTALSPVVSIDEFEMGRTIGTLDSDGSLTMYRDFAASPVAVPVGAFLQGTIGDVRIPIFDPVNGFSLDSDGDGIPDLLVSSIILDPVNGQFISTDTNPVILTNVGFLDGIYPQFGGTLQPEASAIIPTDDGRGLFIQTTTAATINIVAGGTTRTLQNVIEFEVGTLNGGDLDDVHLLQFIRTTQTDAFNRPVSRPLRTIGIDKNRQGEDVRQSTNEYFLDSHIFTDSPFYDTGGGATNRTTDILTIWDQPFAEVDPGGDARIQQFFTYVIVGGEIAYEVRWEKEAGSDEYVILSGNAVDELNPLFNTEKWNQGKILEPDNTLGRAVEKDNPFFTQ